MQIKNNAEIHLPGKAMELVKELRNDGIKITRGLWDKIKNNDFSFTNDLPQGISTNLISLILQAKVELAKTNLSAEDILAATEIILNPPIESRGIKQDLEQSFATDFIQGKRVDLFTVLNQMNDKDAAQQYIQTNKNISELKDKLRKSLGLQNWLGKLQIKFAIKDAEELILIKLNPDKQILADKQADVFRFILDIKTGAIQTDIGAMFSEMQTRVGDLGKFMEVSENLFTSIGSIQEPIYLKEIPNLRRIFKPLQWSTVVDKLSYWDGSINLETGQLLAVVQIRTAGGSNPTISLNDFPPKNDEKFDARDFEIKINNQKLTSHEALQFASVLLKRKELSLKALGLQAALVANPPDLKEFLIKNGAGELFR